MGLFENFPYTNFHEINLDQIIKIMRQMQDEWQQVKNDWDSMQDFINNYFDNLDVSEEVLQALQTMAGDGELNTIIDPVIVAETAAWLAEHITPTSPAVDNTLTIAGAAADAKATGDAVADLKEDLQDPARLADATATNDIFDKYGLESNKYIIRTSGVAATQNGWSVSDFIPVVPGTLYRGININNYCFFDASKNYISGDNPLNAVAPNNARFIRVDLNTENIATAKIFTGSLRPPEDTIIREITFPWLKYGVTENDIEDAVFLNMFDKNTALDGYYLNESTGDRGVASSFCITGYIKAKENTKYTASRELRCAFYDDKKTFISGFNRMSDPYPLEFETPANTAYLAFSINKNLKDIFALCESKYYSEHTDTHKNIIVPWLVPSRFSKYDGKKLVCFGDSITAMGYTDSISSATRIIAENVGLSSGRYAYVNDPIKDAFSFYRIAYAISTGDWTIPESISSATGYEAVYQNILKIKNTDFNTVDFASIAYGTNDFFSGTTIDNPNDPLDTNTFKGAIRYSLKLITEKYPHIKIIGVTPCYRFWSENGVIIDDCDTHEIDGHKLIDYVNAVKEVYTEYHLPVLDNLTNAGINKYNRLEYFGINDGLHPNANGRNIIGQRIGSAILTDY